MNYYDYYCSTLYTPVSTFDPTLLLAILAVTAIVSPVFVAVINNWHQRGMKNMELQYQYYEQKIKYVEQTFSMLLENYGKMSGHCTFENVANFNDSYFKSLPFVSIEVHKIRFETFFHNATNHDFTRANQDLHKDIIPAISAIMKRYEIESHSNCFRCRFREVKSRLRKERLQLSSGLEKSKSQHDLKMSNGCKKSDCQQNKIGK